MGRAKNTINPAEVSSTPIKVKYSVTYESSSLSNYGILIKSGSNITYNVNLSSSQVQEMNNYRLIRQLYYQNYLTGSLVGSASFWDPWWQSTAVSSSGDGTVYKFPTSANESILFYVIPPAQFGEQISRGTFNLSSSNATYNIVDDGNGNLVDILSSNKNVGNIFCAQGLAVITDQAYNTINNSQYHLSFSSETTIYQNEVRCLVNENDFNYTLNPSANKAGTSGSYIDAVTGSDFRPYTTTIGLYNDADQLLLVGKLSRPYAVAPNTDMTFVIRWDS